MDTPVRSNMANWKSKANRKKGKGSQTPGKLKNITCQATGIERIYATRNRSYKMDGYGDWLDKTRY